MLISGLPRLYATTVAACTYEGENTVLYLQTSRFLLKCLTGQHKLGANSQLKFLLSPVAPPTQPFRKELYGLEGASHLVQYYAAAAHRELYAVEGKLKRLQAEGLTSGKPILFSFLASCPIRHSEVFHTSEFISSKICAQKRDNANMRNLISPLSCIRQRLELEPGRSCQSCPSLHSVLPR